MATMRVTWDVTERHEALIDVAEDFDGDDGIEDSILAEHEDDESYQCTPERDVVSAVKV
jgi:hypothetical protein